jgi:RNA polymerase sigma factor for flagellar operon FliA
MRAVYLKRNRIGVVWEKFFKRRDRRLRNLLVRYYLPHVKYAADRLGSRLPRSADTEDLYCAGIEGLIKAVENFDPKWNTKFETYCPRRIEGAILDDLRRKDWIPRLVRARGRQLKKATRKLESLLGRPPTETELAEELGLDEAGFYDLLREANAVTLFSLSREFAGSDGREDFREADGIPDRKSPDPVYRAQLRDLKEYLSQGFSSQERLILILYYLERMTMKEIGCTLDISESRVCQIHASVFARLRDRLHRQSCYENLSPGEEFLDR